MKTIVVSAALLLALLSSAAARTFVLKGAAADDFIAKHFPDADIPGPVAGAFTAKDRFGRRKKGYARCDVPAMGARSDGAVSTCSVRYR